MKKSIANVEFDVFYSEGVNRVKLSFYSISGIDKIGGFEEKYYYLLQEQYLNEELIGQDLYVTPSYAEAKKKVTDFLFLHVEIDTEVSSLFSDYEH